jgi:hypothetical protein
MNEEATFDALDNARAQARKEGRLPTAEEYAAAIRAAEKPEKAERSAPSPPVDARASRFSIWVDAIVRANTMWLDQIKDSPGGFDVDYLAEVLADEDSYCSRDECNEAIKASQESIRLIRSVLKKAEQKLSP